MLYDLSPRLDPIPANDDAMRSIKLLTGLLTDSIMEGRRKFEDSNIAEMARLHEEELESKESRDKETSEKLVEEAIKEDTLKEKEEKRIKPVKRKTYKPQSPKSE